MNSRKREQVQAMSVLSASTVRDAMRAIDRGALGVALVVDEGTERLIGLVTDGDIRRALLSGCDLESPVTAVARLNPITAHVDTPMTQVVSLFNEPVRLVPLLDDDGRVVDIAMLDRRVHLPVAEPSLGMKELQYVSECVLTGWVSSAGKFVTEFEHKFAEFCRTKYAIATSNCTTALHLALLALGIGPGDEIIVPTLTFIATANVVTYTGATPIFVDSEPYTWNLDPQKVEAAITSKTRAIIPVHLYGHPADMDAIGEIAARHGLIVVEDAAEAHGARYKGQRVGGLADIGAFSFYGNKIITTGEGGMLVTDRADLVDKIRMLRDHGMSSERRYWHPVLGYNYRMTNIQAALGVAQMERIGSILATKRQIAQTYAEGLRDVPGIHLPPEAAWAKNVFWLYTILIDPDVVDQTRDEVMWKLKAAGVETRPLFPPLHTQPIYDKGQSFPVAERISATGISLPSSVTLNDSDIEHVVHMIREVCSQHNWLRLSPTKFQIAAERTQPAEIGTYASAAD